MADTSVAADPQRIFWVDRSVHRNWLMTQGQHLLEHYRASKVAGGFGELDDDGQLVDNSAQTIVTARMVHCYSVASLLGVPGAAALADHGVEALLDGPLRDKEHDGWFEGEDPGRKQAYVHAFVALASASAVMALRPRAEELREAIGSVIDKRFWLADEEVMAPSFSANWHDCENYRGANANMHSTEAFLALADATGDNLWLERALAVAKRFCHVIARANNYMLPEHFDNNWQMLPDYNRDNPTDDLRPWGMTPGHFAEWSGLLLKIEAALAARGCDIPDWFFEDAVGLFDNALKCGWSVDGAPGMVYTIGWDKAVSVANRPWWVQAETANTAYMLLRRTKHADFDQTYRMVWDYIADILIDSNNGGWRPEVDCKGNRSREVYPLRNDLYHAFQATLIPLLPVGSSLADSVRRHSV
ncbi:AGE family epimerase/isomerase [Alteromonas pelagimontana]|uniref:AGE family epimerase/isomerase n=1 Tax=Alteromonas pelagimontana TaxID=1858656 RepID=A0A6M4MBR7_9ALTE|nr:AGE family epimerase/isomerase [Alteromonas pelagimontana]QJR80477.1 AGE family epimerase/isomerase [Alteromonas pelagimontana]